MYSQIELRERLKSFMGERDLTVEAVARLVNRHPLTIWKFLRGKTAPHDQTIYRISKLVRRGRV